MLILPAQQIRRGENMVLAVAVEHHHPMIAGRVPEDFGVAFRVNQNRVLLIKLPRAPVIQTVRNALTAIVPAREKRHQRRIHAVRGQPGRVLIIHHAGAGLHPAARVFLPEGRRQFGPMNQIAAHRMYPALRPSLGEQMVLAIVINQAVQIIHPALLLLAGIQPVHRPLAGGKMKLRTQRLVVKRPGRHRQALRLVRLDKVIHIDVAPITAGLIHDLNPRHLPPKPADIPARRHQIITAPARGTLDHLAFDDEVEAGVVFVIPAANAKRNVLPGNDKLRRGQRAGRPIALLLAADHAMIARVLNLQLGQQRIGRRTCAKGGAGRLPIAIIRAAQSADRQIGGPTLAHRSKAKAQGRQATGQPDIFILVIGPGNFHHDHQRYVVLPLTVAFMRRQVETIFTGRRQ